MSNRCPVVNVIDEASLPFLLTHQIRNEGRKEERRGMENLVFGYCKGKGVHVVGTVNSEYRKQKIGYLGAMSLN